jgi:hypothetical protein
MIIYPIGYVNPVPQSVTRLQARLALINASKWDLIKPIILEMSDPEKSIALAWFEDSIYWRRNDPYVTSISALIGLSSNDVDNLFIEASSL